MERSGYVHSTSKIPTVSEMLRSKYNVSHFAIFLSLLAMTIPPTNGYASSYLIPATLELHRTVAAWKPYTKLSAFAKLDLGRNVLSELSMQIDQVEISIPTKDISDLRSPDMDSVKIKFSSTDPGEVLLYMEYSTERDKAREEECEPCQFKTGPAVIFVFRERKYEGREVLPDRSY